MEKTGTKILSDIRASLEALKAQLAAIEEQVAELEGFIAAEEEAVVTEPVVETVQTAEPEPVAEEVPVMMEDMPAVEDLPVSDDLPLVMEEAAEEPVDLGIELPDEAPKPQAALIDRFAEDCAWKTDIPGSEVRNIISGISLNDRILFINTLFKGDAGAFQDTISVFNGLEGLSQAVDYIGEHFPNWNLNSEVVYRFMMAVRRKLRTW